MKILDYRDDDLALDYIANHLFVRFAYSREALADQIMTAMYLENAPLEKYHPKATAILEQLSIALMGTEWCKEWLATKIPHESA